MTDAAAQLLKSFESLPASEQHAVLAALLRRSGELPQPPLNENELTALADELFQSLDAEEDDGDNTRPR